MHLRNTRIANHNFVRKIRLITDTKIFTQLAEFRVKRTKTAVMSDPVSPNIPPLPFRDSLQGEYFLKIHGYIPSDNTLSSIEREKLLANVFTKFELSINLGKVLTN